MEADPRMNGRDQRVQEGGTQSKISGVPLKLPLTIWSKGVLAIYL